ncbi:MAG: hypothetical protein ACE5ET_09700 [Gammaproteobacteria bacterium]
MMTSITIPRDDEGLQRLQLRLRRQGRFPPVSRPQPYGPIPAKGKSTAGHPTPATQPAASRQRGPERRRGERRRMQIPVILDTRGRHERRAQRRRSDDTGSGVGSEGGWDAYA